MPCSLHPAPSPGREAGAIPYRTTPLCLHPIPECGLNAKFIVGLDGDADVVTQHFAKQFVRLRHLGATTNALPEFHLDHRIRALDVTALMVTALKPLVV